MTMWRWWAPSSDGGVSQLVVEGKGAYPNGTTLDHVARRVQGGFRSVSRERFFLPEGRCVVMGVVERAAEVRE